MATTRRRDRHTCLHCQKHRSVFHYRGRVRADRTHTLCPRCFRALVNSRRGRPRYFALMTLDVGCSLSHNPAGDRPASNQLQ